MRLSATLLTTFALIASALGVGAAAPPLQVAEPGTPARCLAVARILAAGEEESVRMGRMLLILGESNNATAEDTTRVQTTVREAEQRRDQAQAVMRRFASIPAPNRETLAYLSDEVSIGALRQELAACASASTASAPVRTLVAAHGFSREDGQDRAGFDLGSIEIRPRDYDACRALCAADDRCRAFNVYTPASNDKSYCWLKHAAGPTRPDPASISGVRAQGYAASTTTAVFDRADGRDPAGNDLGMIETPARDYQRCSALCAADGRCRAFNLYTPPPHDKSYCWLKHTAGPTRADPNSVSGVRRGAEAAARISAVENLRAPLEPWRCAGAARAVLSMAEAHYGLMVAVDPSEASPDTQRLKRQMEADRAIAARMYPDLELSPTQSDAARRILNPEQIRSQCLARMGG